VTIARNFFRFGFWQILRQLRDMRRAPSDGRARIEERLPRRHGDRENNDRLP